MDGFIPVSRRLFEHPFWCEEREFSRFEAWLDLLQQARFEDTKELTHSRLIEIHRGQIPVSLRFLAKRWNWSTKKVNNFLDVLISSKMITKETPKETGQTVVTVCNYDRYNFCYEIGKQQRKHTGNTKETGRKQGGNKDKKDNKGNNIPPYNPPAGDDPLSFEIAWDLYDKKTDRKKAAAKWEKLTDEDKAKALSHIPLYVKATPDRQYRKNFTTYLNGECWNDEIKQEDETEGFTYRRL